MKTLIFCLFSGALLTFIMVMGFRAADIAANGNINWRTVEDAHVEALPVAGGSCVAVYREVLNDGHAIGVAMTTVACPAPEEEKK